MDNQNSVEVNAANIIRSYEEQISTVTRELVMVKAALLQVQEELEMYRLAEDYRLKALEKEEADPEKEKAESVD